MNIEIGSYEAKTKLPELLRGVQAGNRYTITLRGEPIADLLPAESNKCTVAAAAVEQMRQLMVNAEGVCAMSTITFDTLKFTKKLEQAGVPVAQAGGYCRSIQGRQR